MDFNLKLQQYVDWKAYDVIKIKDKYGYRIKLVYMDGTEAIQQKSGYSTKKIAKEARDRTVGELHAGTYIVYRDVKLKDFLEFWLDEEIKPNKTANTYTSYANIVHRHINPSLGNTLVADLNRGQIQKLYNEELIFSKWIVSLVKTVMNVSLQYALHKKIISVNPAVGVDLLKIIERKKYRQRIIDTKKTLTLTQVNILIKASKNTPIYMQVLLNVLMGLRRGEINGIKYTDVDYINRTLTVQRQLGEKPNTTTADFDLKTYTKQEIGLKTSSSYRTLPIPDYVFEAILAQRNIYEKNRRRRPAAFQDLDYICCSSYGRPRSKHYHWKHFKKLLEENDLPDIRWHDLRSTYCTLLLKSGNNPKVVADMMGHATEIISIDIYGDTKEIIEGCLEELQPFMETVLPEEKRNVDTKVIELDELIPKYFQE